MRNSVTQPRALAQVASKSNPSKFYEIRLGGDGAVYCTCPAWKLHGNKWCKHLEEYHGRSQASSITPEIKENASHSMLKFFEKRNPLMQKAHAMDSKGLCTVCGCSARAIEEFGFECNPSETDKVIESIITGNWKDPRKA